jgi:hypothetical protein
MTTTTTRRVPGVGRGAPGDGVVAAAAPGNGNGDGGVGVGTDPRRPRLPGGRPPSTLRRCDGSRPGSGWDRVGPPRPRPRIRPHTCTPLLSVLAWDALHPRRLRRPARSAPRLVTGSSVSSVWRVRSGSPPTALCHHHWVRIVVAHVSLQARTAREHGTPPVGRRTRGPRRHLGRCRWGNGARPDATGCRPRPSVRLGSSRLPAVHLPPVNPVVYRGPYLVAQWGVSSWGGVPA